MRKTAPRRAVIGRFVKVPAVLVVPAAPELLEHREVLVVLPVREALAVLADSAWARHL
jgi:hypothetical protein